MNEAIVSLKAALKLLRFDATGVDDFNATPQGFWHSFRAMALVLPLFMVLLASHDSGDKDFVTWIGAVLVYVISWLLFPLVMSYIADNMGAGKNYIRFIVAYNWSSVWQNLVYLPVAILTGMGIVPPEITFFALVFVLVYSWFVARTALDISTGSAIGIVVLDFLLGIFIQVAPGKFL